MLSALRRLPSAVWRHRWAFIAALLIGLLVGTLEARAQTGTWAADEDGWTDYLVIRPPVLLVIRIDDAGRCLGAPMGAKVEGDTLRRRRGANWGVSVKRGRPDTLTVTLPDTTRTYRRTLHDPVARCTQETNKI